MSNIADDIHNAYEEGYKAGLSILAWIPLSEIVDIPDYEVLCCDKYGEMLIGYLAYENDQWLCESESEMMYDPIAWVEKPEPYKGEQT